MYSSQELAVSSSIVKVLKEYGPIPVEFLAKVLGRRASEIEDHLKSLEAEGLIKRERETVSLVK